MNGPAVTALLIDDHAVVLQGYRTLPAQAGIQDRGRGAKPCFERTRNAQPDGYSAPLDALTWIPACAGVTWRALRGLPS